MTSGPGGRLLVKKVSVSRYDGRRSEAEFWSRNRSPSPSRGHDPGVGVGSYASTLDPGMFIMICDILS